MSSYTPLIIGLGFAARNGKDSAAKAIINHYGSQYDMRRYAFADELKKEVEGIDQFSYCLEHGLHYDIAPDRSDPLCEGVHGKQRAVLQHYGVAKRQITPFYWVLKVKDAIERDRPQVALITDLRFNSEYLFVKATKGYTVKVTRLGYRGLVGLEAAHISETELANRQFDYEINVMEGDLDQLTADAVEVFGMIKDSLELEKFAADELEMETV